MATSTKWSRKVITEDGKVKETRKVVENGDQVNTTHTLKVIQGGTSITMVESTQEFNPSKEGQYLALENGN